MAREIGIGVKTRSIAFRLIAAVLAVELVSSVLVVLLAPPESSIVTVTGYVAPSV